MLRSPGGTSAEQGVLPAHVLAADGVGQADDRTDGLPKLVWDDRAIVLSHRSSVLGAQAGPHLGPSSNWSTFLNSWTCAMASWTAKASLAPSRQTERSTVPRTR